MNKIMTIKGKNIYPFSKENFDAVIKFYFIKNGITDEGPTSIDLVYKKMCSLELFEFEYILNAIIENFLLFKENLNVGNGLTISNLCQYGLDAYTGNINSGSKNRSRITRLFADKLVNSST